MRQVQINIVEISFEVIDFFHVIVSQVDGSMVIYLQENKVHKNW